LKIYKDNKDTAPFLLNRTVNSKCFFSATLALFLSGDIPKPLKNRLLHRIIAMKKILISCLSLCLLAACNKKVDELPPATQTGANTFGAKVDGTMWVPKGFGPFPANDILEARMTGTSYLTINARNFASSPNETEFEILVAGITGPGTYALNNNVVLPASSSYGYYVKRNFTPENEWLTSSAHSGSVTITKLDTVNKIVSGTFQFNALNLYNTPQPISVTEGRFDLRLQ
jgi:hypothetical protein